MLAQPCHLLGCTATWEEADWVVFGAPFDGTCSFRPGTRFAPMAMRMDVGGFEEYSPYQDRSMSDIKVHDAGDLPAPHGNPAEMLDEIETFTEDVLKAGKKPVMIGGEHLLTLGVIRSLIRHYPKLHIIHLDAHTDLRDRFLGQQLSHATVIRRCWELVGDNRIHAYGIRSGEREEFDFGKEHCDYHPMGLQAMHKLKAELEALEPGTPVYVTLDLDVMDPSVFPGTGTPEPGGESFQDLLKALLSLRGLNWVGFDLVELSPPLDPDGISTAAAIKLLREMLLIAQPK